MPMENPEKTHVFQQKQQKHFSKPEKNPCFPAKQQKQFSKNNNERIWNTNNLYNAIDAIFRKKIY